MGKSKKTATAVAIWWVDPLACQEIGSELSSEFSPELRQEYRSRLGRAGRCRLWIPENIEFEGVNSWPDTHFTRWLEKLDCGGIVVGMNDATRLRDLPGVLTTIDLRSRQ